MNGSFLLSHPKVLGLVKTSLRLSTRCASSTTWQKPRRGWTKLNFDGASKTIGNASIGGVYRDHDGCFMLGYAERIGCATSSVAELMACKRGLELALENGWMKIWIEGDAKVVTDLLSKKATVKALEDFRVAKEMRMLVPRLNGFITSHVYRKGNRVAHEFAKLGYKFPKPRIWRGVPPKEVQILLQQDVLGKS